MINKTLKMMWFFYLKFMYRYVYRDLYRQDSQIVETNLRIAFNSSYQDAQYRKFTRKILDRRLRSWINDFWNHPISYLSAGQYLLFSFYKWLQENNISAVWARRFKLWYRLRKRAIWRREDRKWRVFLRYYLSFRVNNLTVIHEQMNTGRGALLCAFHTGYYRVLADYLTALGYRVKLLVDRNVYKREFESIAKKLSAKKEYLSTNTFDFLMAEDPSIGLKILKAFRNNEIVLFFLDGNTGLGKNGSKADTTTFFRQHMYIRRGALQLALKNSTPILPVLSRWKSNWIPEFTFLEPVKVLNPGYSLPNNALTLARHLYSLYERAIHQDPTQWDQWFDCHRFWVNRTDTQAAVSMEAFYNRKKALLEAVERRRKIRMRFCEHQVSYFEGRKGIALVDLHSARFFEAGAFLAEFLPWLKQKKSASLGKTISRWKKKFDKNTIIDAITRLELMHYVEVKS